MLGIGKRTDVNKDGFEEMYPYRSVTKIYQTWLMILWKLKLARDETKGVTERNQVV